MKRRIFTRTSAAFSAGTVLSGSLSCNDSVANRNWAGNLAYHARQTSAPESIESLRKTIGRSTKCKALGSRHSFNEIADTDHRHISIGSWGNEPILDANQKIVTVAPNMRYGDLAIWLHQQGYGLNNLASLPHISIAGACATATHGSGDANGNLATAVVALELMKANGDILTLDQSNEEFFAVVVGLGALGIVTKISLAVEPTFEVRQDLFVDLPLENLRPHFNDITSSGYSVSFFTDWQSDTVNQIWVKTKLTNDLNYTERNDLFGAQSAERKLHPIAAIDPIHCTDQLGEPGPWHTRLPHFKLEYTPSSGEELQSEYFIPRQHAVDAIMAIYQLRSEVAPQILISEIRTIAADELWMSPCYQQECIAIHFTWRQNQDEVSRLLTKIEEGLKPFQVKPHWGKLFNLSPDYLSAVYPKMEDFKALANQYDPDGKFRNAFLETNIF